MLPRIRELLGGYSPWTVRSMGNRKEIFPEIKINLQIFTIQNFCKSKQSWMVQRIKTRNLKMQDFEPLLFCALSFVLFKMQNNSFLLYGANGYSGELIARFANQYHLRPILAGRREEALAPLAAKLELPFRVF